MGHSRDLLTLAPGSFAESATNGLLAGYRESQQTETGHAHAPPLNPDLLDLFLMEKAAYEVAYEAANRPSWIDVPLHGLAERIRHLLGRDPVA